MSLTDNDSGLLLSCLILLTGSLSHWTTGAWRHSAARPNLARFYLRTSTAHMVILILTSSYLVFISEYGPGTLTWYVRQKLGFMTKLFK